MVCISKLTYASAALLGLSEAAPIFSNQKIIGETERTPLTKDILVKQIHSHNDYWREHPLYTALSYGVQSVEADVWSFEGFDKLYVGHHEASLTSSKTFESLYINPLVEIINEANPPSKFGTEVTKVNGVFDTNTDATLYLFVDLKTPANITWPAVEKALQPLRDAGYLSYFNGTDIIPGPVTIIGTGNSPYDYISSQATRDYFFDGPLQNLNESYPYTLNPIASASLKSLIGQSTEEVAITGLNSTQVDSLRSYVEDAHSKGIKTRVWDVSWWPIQKRDTLYRQIIEAESDLLNADDLEWASTFS
jgi:hypothetical protein